MNHGTFVSMEQKRVTIIHLAAARLHQLYRNRLVTQLLGNTRHVSAEPVPPPCSEVLRTFNK